MAKFDIELKEINVEDEANFQAGQQTFGRIEKFIKLGINSKKSAKLLNRMISWKYMSCNEKVGRYYYSGYDVDRLVGGGLLVKAMGVIGITQTNEVGVIFKRADKICNFIKVAAGEFETIKAIKDRIANELKKFWNAYSKNCNDEMDIEEFRFSKSDFRVLYEFLKSRDEKKIKTKYGTAIYNEMIGKKIDDQFAIAAIETIKNEIAKTIKQKNALLEKREKEYEEERDRVYKSWKNDKLQIENEAKSKIANFEEQIKMMMTGAFV